MAPSTRSVTFMFCSTPIYKQLANLLGLAAESSSLHHTLHEFFFLQMNMKPATKILFILLVTTVQISTNVLGSGKPQTRCPETERSALLRIKKDLTDAANRLSSWKSSDQDCCTWVGVSCDRVTGNVKELSLANTLYYNALYGRDWDAADDKYEEAIANFDTSKFRGNVSSSLLNLKQLTHLDLSYNDFSGIPIPSFIGSLTNLRYLNLTEAGFEGMIPHQLGNLSSLTSLSLQSSFDYTSYVFPAKLHSDNLKWVHGLTSLERLHLSCVNLSQASDWVQVLSNLPYLSELNISSCHLPNVVPSSQVNFTSLSILGISRNSFYSNFPEWILDLKNLVSLDLSMNFFTGSIPNGVSNLKSLRNLDLSINTLNGSIPNSLFKLDRLVSINLQSNNLEGPIPCGFVNMTGLKQLQLSWNSFTSAIPDCLYSLRALEILDLSHNNLQGELSNGIGNLTSLVRLILSDNELEGEIPNSMERLCKLKEIDVSTNKMGGDVSQALDRLSSGCASNGLESLIFFTNSFSGQMRDDQFEKFENLEFIRLQENNISGPLPISIGRLSNLTELYLRANRLTGVVSELHFVNLKKLVVLDANENSLVLKVGSNWTPPFQVRNLYLASWQLGHFPKWLKSQSWLIDLDLSGAQISDTMPSWFWNFSSKFVYLNLSHNHIGGQIPQVQNFCDGCTIFFGSNLFSGPVPHLGPYVYELDLSNNSFSGEISDFLCTHKDPPNSLTLLHLGDNQLSGTIPDCWENWSSLLTINLRNNNLIGGIPGSIGELASLEALHLRSNKLSGSLPRSLQNCIRLLILDISKNMFSGRIPRWIGSSLSSLVVLGIRSNQFRGRIPSELCQLESLQILDAAGNNLSGGIPKCVRNFTAMTTIQEFDTGIFGYYGGPQGDFLEKAYVVMKGRESQYDSILKLVASLDLSSNNISGEIPEELTSLVGLLSLNLSNNNLAGKIPDRIGGMSQVESLDLSRNKLVGRIPATMSGLTFLSHLNLSYNMLSGEIPLGTQMQSLDNSSYIGNQLCGPPLTKKCRESGTTEETSPSADQDEEENGTDWFHVYMGLGYAVGFGGVCVPLLLSRTWRTAYFWFLDYLWFGLRFSFTGKWYRD